MKDYPNLTELDIKGTWPHQDIKEFPVWRVPRTNLRWILPNFKKEILIDRLIKRFLGDAEK